MEKKKVKTSFSIRSPKRGQTRGAMELSFGMLFSIILIIIFIAFAIYGIGKFLNLQKNIQTKTFVSDLQFDIDRLWNSQGSQPVEYPIPANIEKVYFAEDSFEKDIDLEFRGEENKFIDSSEIKHAKLSEDFSKGKGGNYVSVENRKIKLQLEKEYGENLVTINKG